jgi:hypothetical protein
MKALTISQPYASLIASGEKWIENRKWETFYRGELAIHAGKGTQYLDKDELKDYPTGCIIAICRLTACVHIDRVTSMGIGDSRKKRISGTDRFWSEAARHSHAEGPYCWIFEDVREVKPLEIRGAQGLWEVDAAFEIKEPNHA